MTYLEQEVVRKRRNFCKLLATSGVSLPLLRQFPLVAGLMANRFALADEQQHKRVIFLFFPGGAPSGTWLPQSTSFMNAATQAYLPVANYCNFYGTEMNNGGPGRSHFALGGRVSQTTVDMQLAKVMGATTRIKSLNLGVEINTSGDLISRQAGVAVRPQTNPSAAYASLFTNQNTTTDLTYAKQKSALDANLAGLKAIKQKLNADEKQQLDQHEKAILDLEEQLAAQEDKKNQCKSPDTAFDTSAVRDPGRTLRQQMDVTLAAMQCGLTNVASIQFSDSNCEWQYNGTFSDSHHNTLYGRPRADLIEIINFFGRQAAYLINRLVNTSDITGKKLIESTVLVQVTDTGDTATFSSSNAPTLVATQMPGFNTGIVNGQGSNVALLGDVARGLGYPGITDFGGGSGLLLN